MAHDLWEVINDNQVEAWGSTKNDDRKGELNPGDVIDILEAYPSGDPEWLQFEIHSGGADLVPHSESPYNEYWVRRDEVSLQQPATNEPDEPEEPPADGVSNQEAGAALRTLVTFLREVWSG